MKESSACIAYRNAVVGSERARHTYRKRLETVRELSGGFEGKQILDVGCGFGFRTLGIASNGAAHVTGIDLDRSRIREGKQLSEGKHKGNLSFQIMDAEALAFREGAFDLVLADEMIHHADHLPQVFAEMHRVLKPGGRVVISDHNRISLPSEMIRYMYFGRNRESVFSAREVACKLKKTGFGQIGYRHIIFTFPWAQMPKSFMRLNIMLENMIERTPFLRLQCGVYVICGERTSG